LRLKGWLAGKDKLMFGMMMGKFEEWYRRADWQRLDKVLLPLRIVGIMVLLVLFAEVFIERATLTWLILHWLAFAR